MCLDLEHVAFVTMSTGDDHHLGQPHIVDETSRSMSVFFQNSSIFESRPSYHFWFLEYFSADLEIRRTRKWQNHIPSAKVVLSTACCFCRPSSKMILLTHQLMAGLADTGVSS